MSGTSVLITGGAGFIGANLAVALASRHADWQITAFDSLHRRGSELNLHRLRESGVRFIHGDVRNPEDLRAAGRFDKLVECSAEPSVMAGVEGASDFLVRTNLLGAYHCLEEAARHKAQVVFLSTSRVYPVAPLNTLAYAESETRFELLDTQSLPGASADGVSEQFPLTGARTLYGATKLAAELLVTEYAASHELATVINRCGVIAGPWQMGKVDQGVFTHWMLAFYFQRPLSYLGFGGTGKQVRDLLHVDDLAELIDDQLTRPGPWSGATVNVGGGPRVSLSLHETSALCREITGHDCVVGSDAQTRAGDIRIYLSDQRGLSAYTNWAPRRSASDIMSDICGWISGHERLVAEALALEP
jgi:CDP-paratose 2-epimerase